MSTNRWSSWLELNRTAAVARILWMLSTSVGCFPTLQQNNNNKLHCKILVSHWPFFFFQDVSAGAWTLISWNTDVSTRDSKNSTSNACWRKFRASLVVYFQVKFLDPKFWAIHRSIHDLFTIMTIQVFPTCTVTITCARLNFHPIKVHCTFKATYIQFVHVHVNNLSEYFP